MMMVAGLVIGILSSGTGLGGGFLVVPLLIMLGKEAKFAVGTSFVFVLLVAISSLLSHFRMGHVDFKTGLFLAAGGIFGAQIGPVLLEHIPDQLFKRLFAGMLVVTAVWLVWDSRA
jgi:uncharacterized membrane protein YfcA